MKDELEQLFEGFAHTHALVIGDVMVDAYLWGKTERMSPEAPVPVVDVSSVEQRPGGAANVALNMAALGAKVTLCTVIGSDEEGVWMERELTAGKITPLFSKSITRRTTVKTRLMSGGQQVVRFDMEKTDDLDSNEERALLAMIKGQIDRNKVDVVVFQDYNKGVLTNGVINEVIGLCKRRNIPTAVDPKKKNFFAYKGVDLFKPNLKEVKEALDVEIGKHDLHQLDEAATLLHQLLNNRLTLITLSEAGVFIGDKDNSHSYPAIHRNIADVSGAGDTVISIAALALARNCDKSILAQLANIAGGLVCEQLGVTPINKENFKNECSRLVQSVHN